MDSSVIIVNRLLAGRPKKRSSIPDREKKFFSFFENSKTDCGVRHSGSYWIVTLNPFPRDKITGLWYRVLSFYSRGEEWVDMNSPL